MNTLLKLDNLKTYFELDEGLVRAVDGVSFELGKGKTVGVVGESGCGKSVTAQSILRIVPYPGKIESGQIVWYGEGYEEGIDLAHLPKDGEELRGIRGKDIAIIFQEPMTAMSPVHTIANQLIEAVLLHERISKQDAYERAVSMLERVGIPQPRRRIHDHTFELSGGLRQRAMIAMALMCSPKLLIADEPTTAIDVTIQAQILSLLEDLKNQYGMSMIMITHDLGVIAETADNVVVMYWGKIAETADVDSIFHEPKHPYTEALLRSIPSIDQPKVEVLDVIKGSVPDPYLQIDGCPFYERCDYGMDGRCNVGDPPPLYDVGKNHTASCLLYDKDIHSE